MSGAGDRIRELVSFYCPGIPQSQNNIQFNAKTGRGYHGNPKLKVWRASVAFAAQQALPEDWEPYEGPVEVSMAYIYTRPKNPSSGFKITVPDVGNLDKAIEDALSGVVYKDDRLIVLHTSVKAWAEEDEEPGVYVKVNTLDLDGLR